MEVSFPVESRVKDPEDWALIETFPGVPPVAALLNRMILEAVTAVEFTVIDPGVPLIFPVTPREALDPVVIESLLPAVPRTRFPLVAVMAPRVAVMVVAAVREPLTDGDPVKAGFAPVEPARRVPVAPTERAAIDEVPAPTRTPCAV